jgi:hypothetical protein
LERAQGGGDERGRVIFGADIEQARRIGKREDLVWTDDMTNGARCDGSTRAADDRDSVTGTQRAKDTANRFTDWLGADSWHFVSCRRVWQLGIERREYRDFISTLAIAVPTDVGVGRVRF